MADLKNDNGSKVTWFVGAAYGGTDDQLPRFLKEGIWESGWEDKHLDVVRSMRPGERIAVKSSYTRKRDLPFDAGAVLNGFIRDAAGIEALGFPTFCRGVYAQDQGFTGQGHRLSHANRNRGGPYSARRPDVWRRAGSSRGSTLVRPKVRSERIRRSPRRPRSVEGH